MSQAELACAKVLAKSLVDALWSAEVFPKAILYQPVKQQLQWFAVSCFDSCKHDDVQLVVTATFLSRKPGQHCLLLHSTDLEQAAEDALMRSAH